LVTWQPVSRPPAGASGPVTGYAVYADGKKVTDVDSPTGDHALIDITKLVGINPQAVTVRTKSRDAQSADSMATPIPRKLRFSIYTRCLHSIFS
jgi:RIMS-binding protein 2